MTVEELKLRLVNKLAQRATYDKELGEWTIEFDTACDIIDDILNKIKEISL